MALGAAKVCTAATTDPDASVTLERRGAMMTRRLQILVTLLTLDGLSAACAPDGLGAPSADFRVIGHRGAPRAVAENTLPSFEVAVVVGANAIELDICVTADDVPVVWHDADPDDPVALARQSGGEGLPFVPRTPDVGAAMRRPVRQLTLAELRAHYGYADALGSLDESAEIPTLEATLAWVATTPEVKTLYLDTKLRGGEADLGRWLFAWLVDAWARHQLTTAAILLNIDRGIVDVLETERLAAGAAASSFRVAWDYEKIGALTATRRAGLRDISVGLTPASTWWTLKDEVAEMVAAREGGDIDSVTVWTVDDESELAELLYYSVDGIMTNDPGLLHRMWSDTQD